MSAKLSVFSFIVLSSVLFGCSAHSTVAPPPSQSKQVVSPKEDVAIRYDIVIYGGGPQAVSAALKASDVTKNKKSILMIVPEDRLGSTWTSGALNLMDFAGGSTPSRFPSGFSSRYIYPEGGSIYDFFESQSISFSLEQMSTYLMREISKHPNISVVFESDIRKVDSKEKNGVYIATGLSFEKLVKKDGHFIFDDSSEKKVEAPIFIDASETGRLVRMIHLNGTVGREDQKLGDSDQMAATLMFKVKGLNWVKDFAGGRKNQIFSYMYSSKSPLGSMSFWSNRNALNTPEVESWNASHPAFLIKPFNAAQDGYSKQDGSTEFWMNMLLIYNVDGRKQWEDKIANDGFYPQSSGLDPDVARENAIAELQKPEFLKALRSIVGFSNAQLIMENGVPVVADELYLRESVHTSNNVSNSSFALDKNGAISGGDKYFSHRIGLGYYQFDNNSYNKNDKPSNPLPKKGSWYIPYETLTSPYLSNILISGYAANIDSFSWTAMRVYPNLCVLGDASGVAAGLSSLGEFDILHPKESQISSLQNSLRSEKAILDK